MWIWREREAQRVEPPGHYGGLEVTDVVPREVGGNHVVQLSYCPPGGGGDMHDHAEDSQLFFVIEGRLAFDTGAEQFTLGRGEGVVFEPGEPHATRNTTEEDCLALVVTVRRDGGGAA